VLCSWGGTARTSLQAARAGRPVKADAEGRFFHGKTGCAVVSSRMNKFEFVDHKTIELTSLQIEGDRVALNSIHERYAPDIHKEFSTDIVQYMGPKPAEDMAETLSYIAESISYMKAGNDLNLVITKRSDGEFLGCCGLHGRKDPRTPELGIWIKKSAHDQQYGQEAMRTLALWAIDNIEFDFLIYPVDKANIASRKIPESLGGTVFHEQKVSTMRETILDQVFYKITRDDVS
jgi:RimJ/RimL family protein N-acetyltransferase